MGLFGDLSPEGSVAVSSGFSVGYRCSWTDPQG